MDRFSTLLRVLDGIRAESNASKHTKLYAMESTELEAVWQARSRAYVHLYLKVMFGIRSFVDREQLVTDGSYDGGIDGYFIDQTARRIFLIQSKFRRSEGGFEGTTISVKEVLAMQIRRILGGEENDESGQPYNGKILGFQRNFRQIIDQSKYKVSVVILANVSSDYEQRDLQRLTDGYEAEVFDFMRAYKELLLPVFSGNLFRAREINIMLDLSNKAAGSKISYNASVSGFDCDITVVFVPIIEVARLMSEYRNSILKYNPRSYLDIEGDGVNSAVRDTVLRPAGNDFALLNNGITLICDESGLSEQSGRKHKAQLYLLNPQIINGGQTAYTLSLIYDETLQQDRASLFEGQEVLVKAIALTPTTQAPDHEDQRRKLIERISTATNSQTAVSYADRVSGDDNRLDAQAAVYARFGTLIEIKRGEFREGVRAGYIQAEEVIERTLFLRLYFLANGNFSASLRKRIIREKFPEDVSSDTNGLDQFSLALAFWRIFKSPKRAHNIQNFLQVIPKVYAGLHIFNQGKVAAIEQIASLIDRCWNDFVLEIEAGQKKPLSLSSKEKRTDKWLLRMNRNRGHQNLEMQIKKFFDHENLRKRDVV